MKSKKTIVLMILSAAVVLVIVIISGFLRINTIPIPLWVLRSDDPAFEYVPANWSKKPHNINMDDMWQSAGIKATGQNYFFFPKPAKGNKYSERFNPQSDYFQSWFGIYTIEVTDDAPYALSEDDIDSQAIFDLAIADQIGWLRSFGMSQPSTALDPSIPVEVSEIHIDGSSGWKITGRLNSNFDVGVDNPQQGLPALLKAPASAWQSITESYGSANLDVVFYVWYTPANKELNVVYYNGVEFEDSNNVLHQTLPAISDELDAMALSVTIRK